MNGAKHGWSAKYVLTSCFNVNNACIIFLSGHCQSSRNIQEPIDVMLRITARVHPSRPSHLMSPCTELIAGQNRLQLPRGEAGRAGCEAFLWWFLLRETNAMNTGLYHPFIVILEAH